MKNDQTSCEWINPYPVVSRIIRLTKPYVYKCLWLGSNTVIFAIIKYISWMNLAFFTLSKSLGQIFALRVENESFSRSTFGKKNSSEIHWKFLKHLLRRNNTFLEAVTYPRKDVDLVTVAMHRARQNSHRKPILECLMWAAIPQVAKKNHGCGIGSERTGRCSILHTSSPHVLSVGQKTRGTGRTPTRTNKYCRECSKEERWPKGMTRGGGYMDDFHPRLCSKKCWKRFHTARIHNLDLNPWKQRRNASSPTF